MHKETHQKLLASIQELMLVQQCVDRHMIPTATVTHPKNVIVPHDALLTENIKDPDYVPYCLRNLSCYRVRRVVDGFLCPNCGNKSNYDLTPFNNNVNVKYST